MDHELRKLKEELLESMCEFRRGVVSVLVSDRIWMRWQEGRILQELQENNKLLRHIYRSLTSHRVLGGVMSQEGKPMVSIAPGNSPVFTVTPEPAGAVAVVANVAWSSTNPLAPVDVNADDPSGLTATVAIDPACPVGSDFELVWTYTNADGTVATVSATYSVVAPPAVNITGGTLAQTA